MGGSTVNRRALICGVSGQDGAYLSRLLLDKGYQVWGTSRDASRVVNSGLDVLGIRDRVNLISMSLTDSIDVQKVVLDIRPDEIYNLAGQSSVALSFDHPVSTIKSISLGCLNILEAVRVIDRSIRFFNAGSSECFGDTSGEPADENFPSRPLSPYGVAKSASTWNTAMYRSAYGIFSCTGILFNHESPIRPERFVSKKIISAAIRIAGGSKEVLRIGNINIQRDWGWAQDYVEAMWRMLNHRAPEDFVIATGKAISLKEFISAVFAELNLEWEKHVEYDKSLIRPAEIMCSLGNPDKALKILGWQSASSGEDVARRLTALEIQRADMQIDKTTEVEGRV